MKEATDSSSRPAMGTVYLIGAGPGDPGLITVKGLETIRTADVVVYDYLATPELLKEARQDAELIYVGKKGGDHTCEQTDINQLLVSKAMEGKNVARLKGGDPYVFGRGGEEAEELFAAGAPFEVVPGVTSAIAAPAYAGIPVTHRDHASMVTFITGHEDPTKDDSALDWSVLARNPGTLVFLMGVKNLPRISESLMAEGKSPDTPAALVRWGTTPGQISLVSTLSKIAEDAKRTGMKPPAILVVGSVAVLHEKLGWFERKPLFGRKILITRSRKQSTSMARKIRELGGEPVSFPTIAIEPPQDSRTLDSCINWIGTFDWIIFTSVNGVELFFQRFFEIKEDIRDLAGPRIAAIGPVTAKSIRDRGIGVELLAKEFVAEGLLAQLSEQDVAGKRFLIPRAEKAREILPEELTRMGAEVVVAPTYRTVKPSGADIEAVKQMLENREVDAVTFTSSSTVTHFVDMFPDLNLGALLDGIVLASIGPITSQTIRESGLTVGVEAAQYTIEGLTQALVEHFSGD